MPLNNYSLTKTFVIKHVLAKEINSMLEIMKPSLMVTAIGSINIWVNNTANTISVGISSDNEGTMKKTMGQIEELITSNDVEPVKKSG